MTILAMLGVWLLLELILHIWMRNNVAIQKNTLKMIGITSFCIAAVLFFSDSLFWGALVFIWFSLEIVLILFKRSQ